MANKQQRYLSKLGFASRNNGASTVTSKINHGPRAFLAPDEAVRMKREKGSRSWRVTGKHPNHIEKKSKKNDNPTLTRSK